MLPANTSRSLLLTKTLSRVSDLHVVNQERSATPAILPLEKRHQEKKPKKKTITATRRPPSRKRNRKRTTIRRRRRRTP
jgi:hypothetical protein